MRGGVAGGTSGPIQRIWPDTSVRQVVDISCVRSARDLPTILLARVSIARQTTSLPEPLVKVMPMTRGQHAGGNGLEFERTVWFKISRIGAENDERGRVVGAFVHYIVREYGKISHLRPSHPSQVKWEIGCIASVECSNLHTMNAVGCNDDLVHSVVVPVRRMRIGVWLFYSRMCSTFMHKAPLCLVQVIHQW
jgi:hypothetical protein